MIAESDCDLTYDDCDARRALGRVSFEAYGACRGSLPECSRALYAALPAVPLYAPGAKFMYSSLGFQFAAAVAVAASRSPISAILGDFVLAPLGIDDACGWADAESNPLLGGGLSCSARGMDTFVHAMLVDKLLPRSVREAMETVQVPNVSMYSTTTAYWGPHSPVSMHIIGGRCQGS